MPSPTLLTDILAVMDRVDQKTLNTGVDAQTLRTRVLETYKGQGIAVNRPLVDQAITAYLAPTPAICLAKNSKAPLETRAIARRQRKTPILMDTSGWALTMVGLVSIVGFSLTLMFIPSTPSPVTKPASSSLTTVVTAQTWAAPSIGVCKTMVHDLVTAHPNAFLTVNDQGKAPTVLNPDSAALENNHAMAPILCKEGRNQVSLQGS